MVKYELHSLATLPSGEKVLIVHYPEGCHGTDDSVGYLWFDTEDLEGYNCFGYPGDRYFCATAEEAVANAIKHRTEEAWTQLTGEAAAASEMFGDDECERYAEELRKKETRDGTDQA